MATFSKGSGYSKADLKTSGKPIILYGRMYTKYETIIRNVDTFAEEKAGSVYSESGDVIVPASGETAQDISRASVVANSGILLGGDINIIHPNNELNPGFLALTISNGNQQKKLSMKAQGATIVHLHNEDLKGVDILCPSIDEQTLISEFFERIDNTITLHQRKLESMKLLKKSQLQKMFPKSGETVPEVRFPGFTDAWEQRKFSEVFYSIPNNTLSRSELSTDEGTVKNIHYGDVLINFDAYIDVQNAVLPRIVNDAKATKAAKSTLKDGDVVIADTAEDETVGKCAEIGNLVNDVVVSGLHTIPSRPKFKFGKGYLGFYMNSSAYHDQLRPLIQGIKVSSISKSALAKTELKYPKNMAEQEKIGSFFLMIDNTITLHQRKVEALQKLKKSLLQQMFV